MRPKFRIVEKSSSTGPPESWSAPLAGSPAASDDWINILQEGDTSLLGRKQEMMLVDEHGKSLWSKPAVCAGVPREAHRSGDRLLVLTNSLDYHAWGFLGPALLLERGSGRLVRELKGERGVAHGSGGFLLGLEGYDAFDTWLYSPDGACVQQWPSYGHYTVDPDGSVRVIEQDRRSPTRSRVVRLKLDGPIQRGARLAEGLASAPVELENGWLVFVDSGTLRLVGRDLTLVTLSKLIKMQARESWRFTASLSLAEHLLEVQIVERSKEPPIDYTTYRWSLEAVVSGSIES